MAESAVSFLVSQLTLLIQREQKLLGGIGDNAVYIRDTLEHMKAFLRVADEKEESDPLLKVWVKQVRGIAYDTEDVFERYMLEFGHLHNRDADGWKWYIKKKYASVTKWKVLHQIASEFQKIKLRMENASESHQRFRDDYGLRDQGSSSTTSDGRSDALLLEEAEVVGIEEPKEQLLKTLLRTHDGLMVISVVGMGGLGKTTLVKKIYDDASVKDNFHSHVWVNVSENFNVKGVLRDMIKKLKEPPPPNLEAMTDDEMKGYIKEFLKEKTYIIVLDDVWKIEAWESIRLAFPSENARGRIIMTTRLEDIGSAACGQTCGYLYHLNRLTPENSRKLFYRKAFPQNSCPSGLKNISESILNRCDGLPLAIVVIGGFLAGKNDFEDWKMFESSIGLELTGNSKMNKIMSLSYNDLPYHLKACLLYLSIFPEDEELSKGKVIRLWTAEGFVEAKVGKTLEDVAETYLNELLNRSLIQVADTYFDVKPRKFRIHDIVREFIISKSTEQNLLVVTCGEEIQCSDKIRRMVINTRFNDAKESYNVKHLRSLFWLEFEDSKSRLIFRKVLGHCKLLKVLDLSLAPIDSIPNEAFKLYHLTYLCLRYTDIIVIPKSIGNLKNLETLDFRHSKVSKLPVAILKLRKLRYLLVYAYRDDVNMKAPYRIGSYLTSLRSLYRIDADEADGIKVVQEIGKLTELRRLGISKVKREDGKDLCSSLAKLTNLRSLHIFSTKYVVMDLDHSLPSSSLPSLRTISLQGCLEKFPQWVCSLSGLTRLELLWNRLKEDPSQHIGALPNLLCLWMARFAYVGEELIFEDGKFQKLKELILWQLKGLKCVRVEKGSMPHLERLAISGCHLMEELPEGIEHLNNLQLVEFWNMSEKFTERVAEEKKPGMKLENVSKFNGAITLMSEFVGRGLFVLNHK